MVGVAEGSVRRAPDLFADGHDELELAPLVVLGELVAVVGAGEPALRAQGEAVEGHDLGGLVEAAADHVGVLELGRLRRDEPDDGGLRRGEVAQRLEPAGPVAVELEEEGVDVEAAEHGLGDRLVAAAGDPPAAEVAPAHVRRDEQVVGTVGDHRVHRVTVAEDELVGIVAADGHLGPEVRVAQVGEAHVVELQVAAAGGVQLGDLGAIGVDEIGPVLVEIRVRLRVDDRPAAHEAGHARPGDRDLRRAVGDRVEVGEGIDEDRPLVAHLADDRRDRRALALAGEVGRPLALRQPDPGEPTEEVEVPPVAAELAVGDRVQPDRLFTGGELGDALVLDGLELVGRQLAVLARLARRQQPSRAEQAPDVVGATGELSHGTARRRGRRAGRRASGRPRRAGRRCASVRPRSA